MSDCNTEIKRIMVAVDGSDQARWALDDAAQLATALGAELAMVHVVNMSVGWAPGLSTDVLTGLEEEGAELLHLLARRLPASVQPLKILRHGYPDREIVAAARDWEADLIVIGAHGRGMVSRFFRLLGSVAEYVLRYAHCPVLTVSHEPAARHVSPSRQEPKCEQEDAEEDALAGAAF